MTHYKHEFRLTQRLQTSCCNGVTNAITQTFELALQELLTRSHVGMTNAVFVLACKMGDTLYAKF